MAGQRLPKTELRQALVGKLLEESQELLAATDPIEIRGELADLLEIIRAIANVTGVGWQDVNDAADEKRGERGGFDAGAVLLETSWPTPGRAGSRDMQAVPLRSLARIETKSGETILSFNAIVANRINGAEVPVGERILRVRLGREGFVFWDVTDLPQQTDGQLDLPLE